jgi:hypothetical protein
MPLVQAQRVGASDIHRARAADALAARAAKRQGGVDLVLDPQQPIEHHRSAIVAIDEIGIEARVLAAIRVVAIDAVFLEPGGSGRLRPGLARHDLRVLGKRQLGHGFIL